MFGKAAQILLVEPAYETKYPSLALMKISALHKQRGDRVRYVKGISERLPHSEFDRVYVTSLFTYEADTTIRTITFYQERCRNAQVLAGGVFCSLMPQYVLSKTGIRPHVGLWMDVEFQPPDYDLASDRVRNDTSFVFTTRGCPQRCGFCAVKTLEPEPIINPRWREHINFALPRVMIHDNNITAAPFSHFQAVMKFLAVTKKQVTFDNGFDCRLLTEAHCDLLARVNVESVRFAFDNVSQDGHLQRAIALCLRKGVPASKILVYILFNYRDTPEDALYRATEVAKLGVRPYAMQYAPLNATESFVHYFGRWNLHLCRDFSLFVNNLRLANKESFDEWRAQWRTNAHSSGRAALSRAFNAQR